jgi:hypothetical protein
MVTEPSKLHAKRFFEQHGYDVEEIPVGAKESADLRVRKCSEEYLVESKARCESGSWLALRESVRGGGGAHASRAVEPWNAISAMISKAVDQLDATPAASSSWRLLWVLADHPDDQFVLECVSKRLCGTTALTTKGTGTFDIGTRDCFYYCHNDFRRFPSLDAAVLANGVGLRMYVNSFSPRREALRSSGLYLPLSNASAVCDPEVLERDGEALLLGADFDPAALGNDPQRTYLKSKYGLWTCPMNESQFVGVLAVADRPGKADG